MYSGPGFCCHFNTLLDCWLLSGRGKWGVGCLSRTDIPSEGLGWCGGEGQGSVGRYADCLYLYVLAFSLIWATLFLITRARSRLLQRNQWSSGASNQVWSCLDSPKRCWNCHTLFNGWGMQISSTHFGKTAWRRHGTIDSCSGAGGSILQELSLFCFCKMSRVSACETLAWMCWQNNWHEFY